MLKTLVLHSHRGCLTVTVSAQDGSVCPWTHSGRCGLAAPAPPEAGLSFQTLGAGSGAQLHLCCQDSAFITAVVAVRMAPNYPSCVLHSTPVGTRTTAHHQPHSLPQGDLGLFTLWIRLEKKLKSGLHQPGLPQAGPKPLALRAVWVSELWVRAAHSAAPPVQRGRLTRTRLVSSRGHPAPRPSRPGQRSVGLHRPQETGAWGYAERGGNP